MASNSTQSKGKEKITKPIDYEKTPLWRYVLMGGDRDNGGGNRTWTCNFCNTNYISSYQRVKAHLLRVKNQGIRSCPNVTLEIQRQMQLESDNADRISLKKTQVVQQRSAFMSLPSGSDLVQPKKRRANQTVLENAFNMQERDTLDKECARMFYSAALPFNLARNPFFQEFCFHLSTYSVAGYRPPSYNRLRTSLLTQENTHVERLLQPIKDGWKTKGVSICSDGWSDVSSNPIINIMAACGSTAIFIDSVDASGIRKDANYVAHIFDEAVNEIGVENVVQIVTDNGSNFKAAGGIIEQKHPSIFWTPCVVHCLNLAFKSICEPSEKSDHYEQCKWLISLCDDLNEIQKFVMGHDLVKSLFIKNSPLRLLQVAETRFASHYVVAQRLSAVKSALDKMVIDSEWKALFKSNTSPLDMKARKIKMLILDDCWWEKVEYFLDFMKPLYDMIRFGDTDGPMLHLIYDMWDTMIEQVKIAIFKKEGKNIDVDSSLFFDAIQQVLEARWNKSNTPLHCLAHSLVPRYYSTNFLKEGGIGSQRVAPHQDEEVSTHRNLCFQRLYPDEKDFRAVLKEYGSFSSSLDYFSQAHVIAARDYEEPISWWANHGSTAKLLQALAFRLLSQPASSSCCERNWSQYGNIKTTKRNRLTSDRAKTLVKVHNNLRLLSRQEESYKQGPCKYWDIGGDKYDVDAEVQELADLSINDPDMEGVVYDLGDYEE